MSPLDNGKLGTGLLYEARGCNPQAMSARLTATGFDISWKEILVLAAIFLTQNEDADLMRKPEFGRGVTAGLVDSLILRGYLESPGDNPDGGDQPETVITRRGGRALFTAMVSVLADRWACFPFRPDDIIISTPVKSGTTWMQMICALLIFQAADLPAPLGDLSPWMDGAEYPREAIFTQLSGQRHRRFMKTHSPLADITAIPQVTYIVVGRHPLDAGISLYHQADNMRVSQRGAKDDTSRPSPREWLLKWIADEPGSPVPRDSLPGIFRHMSGVWARRDAPNVVLVHYEDLCADLVGQMRYIAERLGITVPEATWPSLVEAATFGQMRAAANRIQPLGGLLKDNAAFFRTGGSGAGTDLLSDSELADYHAHAARVLDPDLLTWLHRSRG